MVDARSDTFLPQRQSPSAISNNFNFTCKIALKSMPPETKKSKSGVETFIPNYFSRVQESAVSQKQATTPGSLVPEDFYANCLRTQLDETVKAGPSNANDDKEISILEVDDDYLLSGNEDSDRSEDNYNKCDGIACKNEVKCHYIYFYL